MLRPRRSIPVAAAALALLSTGVAVAQRYSGLSSPPTAPPLGQAKEAHTQPTGPVLPVSSGMGAIQFYPVNYGAPAPQTLTRQLTSTDERLRLGALQALGAPTQYTQKGHVPFPHSLELELAALGNNDDIDALLTVELDHHIVTAVLAPQGDEWRRVATVIFPTGFADPSTTPSTFLRTTRSLQEPTHYRATFRARETQADGDYIENEAHLRVVNGRAIITISFASEARTCNQPHPDGKPTTASAPACEITHRWLQPDPLQQPGVRHVDLVTATGALTAQNLANPLASAHDFQFTHIKTYTCQPFIFSDADLHYIPTAPVGPCKKPGTK